MKIASSIFLLFIFLSCATEQKEKKNNLTFNGDKSLNLEQSKLLQGKEVLPFLFSNSSMINRNAAIIKGDCTFFVYSKNTETAILMFNSKGHFIGNLGRIGDGPGEYWGIYDIAINPSRQAIEVLSDGNIFVYSYLGDFLEKKEIVYPAFSFVIDEYSNYWFYIGNNSTYGDAKIVKTDYKMEHEEYFLKQKSDLLPMVENNFSKNHFLTFHESLNHNLYVIQNGSLNISYGIDFPSYKLPSKLHELSGGEVVDVLHKSNYASILNYMENNKYLFIDVLLNNADNNMIKMYYWIIDKDSREERIIQIDTQIPHESYLFNPQFLSDDNILYCLGYEWEISNVENMEENSNPSVISLDLDCVFDNKKED